MREFLLTVISVGLGLAVAGGLMLLFVWLGGAPAADIMKALAYGL